LDLRELAGEVARFIAAWGEVVEGGLGSLEEEFVIAAADGPDAALVETPEQEVMRVGGFFSGEMRHEIHSIERMLGDAGGTGEREGGGEDIEAGDGSIICFSRRKRVFPLGEEGNADAALPHGALATAEGSIRAEIVFRWTAIVAEEKNEGAFFEVVLAELCEHATDRVIEAYDHGSVGAAFGICDGFDAFQKLRRGLEGRVRGIEGGVKKPRLFSVAMDE